MKEEGFATAVQSDIQEASAPVVPKEYRLYFGLLVTCFALWGLLNNMTDNLVPSFAKIFMIKAVDSSLVQVAFYGAYAVLALPAAFIIKRYSYRVGVLVGLGFYMVGAFGYIPAAILQSYNLFLVSIFVLAGGLSVLETTCNPFVLSLGDESTSVRRLNFAQAFNPLGSMAGLFLAKYVILSHLNPATLEDRLAMTPDQLAVVRDVELFWVCVPYVGLILIAFIIWCAFFRSKLNDKDAGEEMTVKEALSRLIHLPRYAFGVVTQFFYVGVQIAVWTWTIKYAMVNLHVIEAEAANFYIYSIFLFIGCRWICTWLMKYITPAKMMAVFALGGILCCFGTIYLPIDVSIYCLIGISGCMSLMFPTIYGIALRGLGPEVKFGAAGLIMAILGGAIITPMMGALVDNSTLAFLVSGFNAEQTAIRSAFYLPTFCFAVVLVYSLAFRNVKD
ncbi:L-fucose:H+ symporter permease [Mitsuokella jalaludinii]|uniref:L-fucose:H+ symporter permease n=1 Tax=Mitsuokella jalaludinii TaxID=187979 RepID=UPI0024309185|nr:L-fucose:H+ symporter permease [Mitsuokella jalaludinii]MCI6611720.1 L-fucose:H+ symporter permease [Mitsuokella jalaludinii]